MVDSKMRDMGSQKKEKPQKQTVFIQSFGVKFQTKKAIHQFLTVEVRAYLPAKTCVTMYFMRDIITGKRKCENPFL